MYCCIYCFCIEKVHLNWWSCIDTLLCLPLSCYLTVVSSGPEKVTIKLFYWTFTDMEKYCLLICESHGLLKELSCHLQLQYFNWNENRYNIFLYLLLAKLIIQLLWLAQFGKVALGNKSASLVHYIRFS